MPAYLGDAARSYNRIRQIQPNDPIAQLAYYRTSSSSFASSLSHMNSRRRQKRNTVDPFDQDGPQRKRELSANSSGLSEIRCQRDGRITSVSLSPSSSSYSSKLMDLMLRRHNENETIGYSDDHRSRVVESSADDNVINRRSVRQRLITSGQLLLKSLPDQVSKRLSGRFEAKLEASQKQASSVSPPFESSGFSEETVAGTMRGHKNPLRLDNKRPKQWRQDDDDEIDWSFLPQKRRQTANFDSFSTLSARQKQQLSNLALTNYGQQQSRTKRRKINRGNRRMLVSGADAHGNPMLVESNQYGSDPYALSELFSQSEIPGFREIFSSNSYLRKFCWIVAFLFMTVLSFNDISELVTEYFEYPITVNVRLRDTARLPFPAVTVCNLNVVRYSGLCSSARFELVNQIPGELRDKLCGIQVDKKKNTTSQQPESDNPSRPMAPAAPLSTVSPPSPTDNGGHIDDINNIVITTTTTSPPPTSLAATMVTTEMVEESHLNSKQQTKSSSSPGLDGASSLPSSSSQPTHLLPSTQRPSGSLDLGSDFVPVPRSGLERNKQSIMNKLDQKRSIKLDADNADRRPFASSKWWTVQPPRVAAINRPLSGSEQMSKLANSIQTNRGTSISGKPNTQQQQLQQPVGPTQAPPFAHIPSNNHSSLSLSHSAFGVANPTNSPIVTTTFSPPSGDGEFELTERQERELQENLTNWLAVMYQLDSQLTRSLGHQFDDMILRCTMKSINCTRQRAFDWSFSPTEGNCFTYRSKTRKRTVKDEQQFRYEEANLAGTNDGLELVLNLEKAEYISGSSQVGALVMVHHPDELGYAASEATFIAPEFTTYIGLKMMNITRLPAPYPEHCVDSWPAKFQDSSHTTRNSTYSQQTCLKICLQKTIQAHCACQSAFLPIVEAPPSPATSDSASNSGKNTAQTSSQSGQNDTGQQTNRQRVIICDTRKKQTRQCVRDVNLRAADRVHHCECPPKCQVVRYDKTISVARWPTREDNVTFDRGKMDVNFQNLAKVIVYFQTMTCEEVTQQAVFNAAKIFSALGGIMGMYVGFSFLSVFEIFEVMSRKLWHYARSKLSSAVRSRRQK